MTILYFDKISKIIRTKEDWQAENEFNPGELLAIDAYQPLKWINNYLLLFVDVFGTAKEIMKEAAKQFPSISYNGETWLNHGLTFSKKEVVINE